MPEVCLSGGLDRILIGRQNWIAASDSTAGRPSRSGRKVMSLSNQINSCPRFLSVSS